MGRGKLMSHWRSRMQLQLTKDGSEEARGGQQER